MLKADKRQLSQDATAVLCNEEFGVVALDSYFLYESLVEEYLLAVIPDLVEVVFRSLGVSPQPKVVISVGDVEIKTEFVEIEPPEEESPEESA